MHSWADTSSEISWASIPPISETAQALGLAKDLKLVTPSISDGQLLYRQDVATKQQEPAMPTMLPTLVNLPQ